MRRGSASSVCCWPDQLAVCVSRGCGTSQQRAVGRQAPLCTPDTSTFYTVTSLARPSVECARPDVGPMHYGTRLNGTGLRFSLLSLRTEILQRRPFTFDDDTTEEM